MVKKKTTKKKTTKKAISPAEFKKQMNKEIKIMHKVTEEYIKISIALAKLHPKGLSRIQKHVKQVAKNMDKINNIHKKLKIKR